MGLGTNENGINRIPPEITNNAPGYRNFIKTIRRKKGGERYFINLRVLTISMRDFKEIELNSSTIKDVLICM
jgi:Leucine-rich repeat (LRR) protein